MSSGGTSKPCSVLPLLFFVMILLFSSDNDEITRRVSCLLKFVGADFLEVNDDVLSQNLHFNLSALTDGTITLQGRTFLIDDVRAVWYYRFLRCPDFLYDLLKLSLNQQIATQVSLEVVSLYSFLPNLFLSADIIGDTNRLTTNKLQELLIAKRVGLSIPDSYIVAEKRDLEELYRNYSGGLVVKSLYNAQVLYFKEDRFPMFVKLISSDEIARLPTHFLPSLVQERVQKKCDVRIFYLQGECFAVSIATEDMNEHVDYRAYLGIQQSRFSRFTLDEDMKNKISNFMRQMDLTMGSLDFILSSRGELVFLEVNNNGSLETVDDIYNYAVSRTIVDHLCKLNYI